MTNITARMKRIGLSLPLQIHQYSSNDRRRLGQKRKSPLKVAAVFLICVITVASPTATSTTVAAATTTTTIIGISSQRDGIAAQHFIEDTPAGRDDDDVFTTIRTPNKVRHQKLQPARQRPRRGGFFKPNAAIHRNQMVRGGSVSSHHDDDNHNHNDNDLDSTSPTNSLDETVIDSVDSTNQSKDQGISSSSSSPTTPPTTAAATLSELEIEARKMSSGVVGNGNTNLQTPLNTSSSASGKMIPKSNGTYRLSIHSIQGKRQYMEDEYFANEKGSFVAVMDGYVCVCTNCSLTLLEYKYSIGLLLIIFIVSYLLSNIISHGGNAVSRYLRQNLYARYLQAKSTAISTRTSMERNLVEDNNSRKENEEQISDNVLNTVKKNGDTEMMTTNTESNMNPNISALKSAFEKIDNEVQRISHWSFQGSTAVAVLVCDLPLTTSSITEQHHHQTKTMLVSANVGDSRAVLSRAGKAVALTKDHKPNDPSERARIEKLGGRVDWCGPRDPKTGGPKMRVKKGEKRKKRVGGVYRINGNLALSRAIGDRSEKPLVSSKVDINEIELDVKQDEFIVIASDGLWDVLSNQETIDFCYSVLAMAQKKDPEILDAAKSHMAKLLVEEAQKRGSMDNISAVIIWFQA